MQPLGPFAPTMVVDGASMPISDYVELNGYNLASHTTALEQSLLGKPHLMPVAGLALMPPTVCGKRSRSNSDASSYSSSAASSHASVFSSENDGSESGYDSQTSIGEQTPSSRKSSMSETSSHQQLENLAIWRADLLSTEHSERERCAKRIRDLQGEVVRLASEVVHVASQPAQPSVAAPAAPAAHSASTSSISPASSSSSSSSEGTKNALVDCLVDAACRTLDAIWNASNPSASCDLAKGKSALPLQVFVRETLRRGRTSCSTLQAALLYCVRLGEAAKQSKQMSLKQSTRAAGVEVEVETQSTSPLLGMTKEELCLVRCPRRMFLASIMVASKFVQDRTYSNRAWSKISGLPVKDLGKMERAFLKAIDYRLMVSEGEWELWTAELKRAHAAQNAAAVAPAEVAAANGIVGRRSSLSRSQSDNVTGAAVALDTELRAVSPRLPSQVQPKYRHLDDDAQQISTHADMALPFPRAAVAVTSAEI
ncbi:related to PCL5 - cyclin [Ustilago trichophora]|uniref:Related to PCL5 - cyclin n=1 Tax=Ustilago trichophora TaxID=86804 RepID=A0A5C3ENN0_9BASI|nr:related to PCL5 - cyclin [Ustilago trichophora]